MFMEFYLRFEGCLEALSNTALLHKVKVVRKYRGSNSLVTNSKPVGIFFSVHVDTVK